MELQSSRGVKCRLKFSVFWPVFFIFHTEYNIVYVLSYLLLFGTLMRFSISSFFTFDRNLETGHERHLNFWLLCLYRGHTCHLNRSTGRKVKISQSLNLIGLRNRSITQMSDYFEIKAITLASVKMIIFAIGHSTFHADVQQLIKYIARTTQMHAQYMWTVQRTISNLSPQRIIRFFLWIINK